MIRFLMLWFKLIALPLPDANLPRQIFIHLHISPILFGGYSSLVTQFTHNDADRP